MWRPEVGPRSAAGRSVRSNRWSSSARERTIALLTICQYLVAQGAADQQLAGLATRSSGRWIVKCLMQFFPRDSFAAECSAQCSQRISG
jgi:hypothetical protein